MTDVKVITEPKVYVIAFTNVIDSLHDEDIPALEEFLKDEGLTEEDDLWERLFVQDDTTSLDALPELAGRVCYSSYGRKGDTNARYVGHIMESGHGSVLEHSSVTLAFTGISRSLSLEMVRHRAGFAYSQRSQRFVNEGEMQIVMPPMLLKEEAEEERRILSNSADIIGTSYARLVEVTMAKLATPEKLVEFAIREKYLTSSFIENTGRFIFRSPEHSGPTQYIVDHKDNEGDNSPRTAKEWEDVLKEKEDVLKEFKKATLTARRKTAREAARSVLPNCAETKMFVTANLRAWRHFLEMRGAFGADREIRRLAVKVVKVLSVLAPNCFGDYEVKMGPDSAEFVEGKFKKV